LPFRTYPGSIYQPGLASKAVSEIRDPRTGRLLVFIHSHIKAYPFLQVSRWISLGYCVVSSSATPLAFVGGMLKALDMVGDRGHLFFSLLTPQIKGYFIISIPPQHGYVTYFSNERN
jgi:hypothetical protein